MYLYYWFTLPLLSIFKKFKVNFCFCKKFSKYNKLVFFLIRIDLFKATKQKKAQQKTNERDIHLCMDISSIRSLVIDLKINQIKRDVYPYIHINDILLIQCATHSRKVCKKTFIA